MNTSSQSLKQLAHLARPRPAIIVAIFFVAILVGLASREVHPSKPMVQVEFEEWFTAFEQKQKNGLNLQEVPNLSLRINARNDGSEAREFHVTGTTSNEDGEHVMRLLQMIRESEILANAAVKPGDSTSDVAIKIENHEKSFSYKISQDSLTENVKAGLFLKLFEEFSKTKTAAASKETSQQKELTPEELSALPQDIQDAIANSKEEQSKQEQSQ